MAENGNKKERRFNKRMQIKLTAVFAAVLLVLVFLLIRITYIIASSGNTSIQALVNSVSEAQFISIVVFLSFTQQK